MVRKKWLSLYISQYLWVLHSPNLHQPFDMIYWCHAVVCVLDLHFTLEWRRYKMAVVCRRCEVGWPTVGLPRHRVTTLTSGHFVSPPTTCIYYDRIFLCVLVDSFIGHPQKLFKEVFITLSCVPFPFEISNRLHKFAWLHYDCIALIRSIRPHISEVESNVLGLKKWMQMSLVCILKLCWHSQAVVDPNSIRPCFVFPHSMR